MPTPPGRVLVVGGGIGGLTAAHELAERGFEVTLVEKSLVPGGKARSVDVPGPDGRPPLPGEHGFRFFPGFYRHLPDTMKRIPGGHGGTVEDSLVPVLEMMFAHSRLRPLRLPARLPRTWREVRMMADFLRGLGALGLTVEDLVFYLGKMWRVLTSCEARRLAELEPISWWEYVEADRRSAAYRDLLVVGVTRNLVAARAEDANARTVGIIGLQLLRDLFSPGRFVDRILDGPTNDVWIEPWLEHLAALGVRYEPGWEMETLELAGGEIRSVGLRRSAKAPGEPATRTVSADHYLLALPVDVVARLLDRHPEVVRRAPDLAGVDRLARDLDWMNGIQFYLTESVPVCAGHVNFVDSPWALTSICHSQFWPRHPSERFGDGTIRTVLSVDVSYWAGVGHAGREAWDCTAEEVAAEVWAQLKRGLNHDTTMLSDEMLHPSHPFFLDDDIQERIEKDGSPALPPDLRARRARAKALTNTPGAPDLLTNAEPLLVNLEDTWRLRPEATTGLRNLYLAGDYVRTHTNLATMEAANEAARRAVNGILDAAGSAAPRCPVWPLQEPLAWLRALDAERFPAPWKNLLVGDAGGRFVGRLLAWSLRAFVFVARLPIPLLLFLLFGGTAMSALAATFDTVWETLGRAACTVMGATGPAACAGALPPRTAAAVSVFWFGVYAILFGLSLFVLPKRLLRKLGFPREEGPWMIILGSAPVLIGVLYITGALFDLRPFFWAIVFGRVGVFLLCLWLRYERHQASGLLLWAAAPDLAGAFWTAFALSPRASAGLLLVLGLSNIIVAAAFRWFPTALRLKLGFPATAGSWLPLASALLAFWGAYETLAAVLNLVPLFWASVLCHLVFGAACVAGALAHRGSEAALHVWRLALAGMLYAAAGGTLGIILRAGA